MLGWSSPAGFAGRVCWWAIAVAATALDATSTERVVFDGRWVLVVVLGGYAQILWGSLAYLMPMLRGGDPERLSAGFAMTRSWVGLAAARGAAVSVAVMLPAEATAAAIAAWVLDSTWRAGQVGTARASRTTDVTPSC